MVFVVLQKEVQIMERKLLTNGKAFQRTEGKWQGTIWFMDEYGERRRKSFAANTQRAVNKRMKDYIEDFRKHQETAARVPTSL